MLALHTAARVVLAIPTEAMFISIFRTFQRPGSARETEIAAHDAHQATHHWVIATDNPISLCLSLPPLPLALVSQPAGSSLATPTFATVTGARPRPPDVNTDHQPARRLFGANQQRRPCLGAVSERI